MWLFQIQQEKQRISISAFENIWNLETEPNTSDRVPSKLHVFIKISVQAAVIAQLHVLFIWAHVSLCTAGMFSLSECSDQLMKNVCSPGCFGAGLLKYQLPVTEGW